jgi:predicted nicotinamide N-methyase
MMSSVRFRYQTIELGETDYHLRTLRDLQQCPDDLVEASDQGVSSATWPLFGVLWQSEELLSGLMVTQDIKNIRILEVGCGTALASIVLRRRGADITATDYNPDAQAFLTRNTSLNELAPILCVCTNWHDSNESLGRFDLIIGSDLLYDPHNVKPLVNFLKTHANPNCGMVIVDPRRGLTGPFIRQVQKLGFSVQVEQLVYPIDSDAGENFLIMRFSRS